MRVFEHWAFQLCMPRTRFDIVHVPGASATGMRNPKSLTQARRIFREALSAIPTDLVVLHLGEVDTAYTIWQQAARRGTPVENLLQVAVDRYWNFVIEVRATRAVAVLSACLPTLSDQGAPGGQVAAMRSAVPASQRERTLLTLSFNEQLSRRCRAAGIPFLDSSVAALAPHGIVKPAWVNRQRYDHHYARRPFAFWLIKQFRVLRKSGAVPTAFLARPASLPSARASTAPANPSPAPAGSPPRSGPPSG